MDIIEIEDSLRDELPKDRFRHTMGVANTAACLAMRFGYDSERAYLTGLLHDCSKGYKSSEQAELAGNFNLKLSEIEVLNPALIHAKTGAYLANLKYGIKDEEILSAIRCHTTGKPDMTMLEKIIYIADYIEPNRKKQPHLKEIRKACFEDLDKGLLMILSDTVEYLKNNSPENIDEMTLKTCEYYLKESN